MALIPLGADLGAGLLADQLTGIQPDYGRARANMLLSLGAGLMGASAPSTDPGAFQRGVGNAVQNSLAAYQQGRQEALRNALMKREMAKKERLGQAVGSYFEDPKLAAVAQDDPQLAMQLSQLSGDPRDPASWRSFEAYAEAAGLKPGTPEYQRAAKVHLGLVGRASSAGYGFTTVKGADGRDRVFVTDPRTGQIIPGQVGTPVEQFNAAQGGQPTQSMQSSGASVPTNTPSGMLTSPTERQSAFDVTAGKQEAARLGNLRETYPKAVSSLVTMQDRAQQVEGIVNEILPQVGVFTAGLIGAKMDEVAGTPAADLAADLKTLKAISGFAELQKMREESPKGGALGQVTEQELALLQSLWRNIENAQSPEQLRENLTEFAQVSKRLASRSREAFMLQYEPIIKERGVPGSIQQSERPSEGNSFTTPSGATVVIEGE